MFYRPWFGTCETILSSDRQSGYVWGRFIQEFHISVAASVITAVMKSWQRGEFHSLFLNNCFLTVCPLYPWKHKNATHNTQEFLLLPQWRQNASNLEDSWSFYRGWIWMVETVFNKPLRDTFYFTKDNVRCSDRLVNLFVYRMNKTTSIIRFFKFPCTHSLN